MVTYLPAMDFAAFSLNATFTFGLNFLINAMDLTILKIKIPVIYNAPALNQKAMGVIV